MLNQIKNDYLSLRKLAHCPLSDVRAMAKVQANALSTFLGDVDTIHTQRVGSNWSDEETTNLIKIYIKNIDRTIDVAGENENLKAEKDMFSAYLPKTFDEFDIKRLLADTPSVSLNNIGAVMKLCKEEAAKQSKMFDGAIVKKVIGK